MGMTLAVACAVALAGQGQGTVDLVRNGRPQAIVVIAENPTRAAHVAAKEFLYYVQKMTGVELPLYVDTAAPRLTHAPRRVLIGESLETRALGLTNGCFQEQEYLIETRGQTLILMGRDAEECGIISYEENGLWPSAPKSNVLFTPMGSLYAVDCFLEESCGVRWYLPGEIGEVCPNPKLLVVSNLLKRAKPWSRYRLSSRAAYRDPFHFVGWAEPDRLVGVPGREMSLWLLRMKVGGSPFACNHSVYSYEKRFVTTHPEWWKEGRPTPAWPHPDYANPSFIKQVTRDAMDYFDGKLTNGMYADGSRAVAGGNYFAVMPLDGRKGLIWSTAGEKLRIKDPDVQSGFSCGWGSDFVFNWVGQVAQAVGKRHPQAVIACAAYGPYYNPPRYLKSLPTNIAVQPAGWLHRAFSPAEWDYQTRAVRAWCDRVKDVYVWEYYLEQSQSRFQSFPAIFPHQIARCMRFFHDVGIKGMFFEASAAQARPDNPSTDGHLANPAEDLLNHYVTWKMLCDATVDVDKLLDEHYALFYGPAAKPMAAFCAAIEAYWADPANWGGEEVGVEPGTGDATARMPCTMEAVRKLEPAIRAAMAAATNEPYRTRVEMMYRAVYRPAERTALRNQEQLSARRRLVCPPGGVPPSPVAGSDDPRWAGASQTSAFTSLDGIACEVATTARVSCDRHAIHVAFDCPEPRPPAAGEWCAVHDDPAVASNDNVQVALDVNRSRSRVYWLTVNRAGTIRDVALDAGGADAAWESGARAAVTPTTNGWAARIEIPLAALGVTQVTAGAAWGLNLGRYRAAASDTEGAGRMSAWAPTFSAFTAPNEFGVLDLTPRPPPEAGGAPQPVVRFDFEELRDGHTVPDRAGVAVAGSRQFSHAFARVLGQGRAWSTENLVGGLKGKALRFGGAASGQFLEFALAPAVNLANDDFSIALWCQGALTGGTLLLSTTSRPAWSLHTGQTNGQTTFHFGMSTGDGAQVGGFVRPEAGGTALNIADGKWHHVVLAVDRGRNVRLYVDRLLSGTWPTAGRKGDLKQVLTIGGPYGAWAGAVDEFAIYPGAVGQAEVDALFAQNAGAGVP